MHHIPNLNNPSLNIKTNRHYGMDWLRIFAFALLIIYHICMYFVPWPWHINRIEPINWIAAPMLAMNSWRLILLFIVSGYASAAIIKRQTFILAFARERSARLLIPVIFAIIFIIPIQPWIELVTKSNYQGSFESFWLSDYWAFTSDWGMFLPTWQHLWFVCYLWGYTMAIIIVRALISLLWREKIAQYSAKALRGIAIILLPCTMFIILVCYRGFDSVRLDAWVDGAAAHLVFFGSMLLGYLLYNMPSLWDAIRKYWFISLIMAFIAFAALLLVKILWGEGTEPSWAQAIFAIARPVHGWTVIIALLGMADKFANHDGPYRATLTQAVFPFYIIHQTIIVGVAYIILPYMLPMTIEFTILTLATIVGCWLFYYIGKSMAWFRPFIGLKR